MRTFISILLLYALSVFPIAGAVADDKTEKQDGTSKAGSQEQKPDRYLVPEGDAAELLKFIEQVQKFQPKTSDEHLQHRQKALRALQQAAERILKLEKDPASEAARTATGLLLELKIRDLPQTSRKDQREVFEAVHQHLIGLSDLSADELKLAYATAVTLERAGNSELAAKSYDVFGQMFVTQQDEALASYGKMMIGAGRRVNLVGNEMEISGLTLDGDTFDWTAYRGKVVLVDFGEPWCGPCVAELPNVKKYYDEYHERGFDVVGISLDTNRDRLAQFVAERELPWTTLFEEGRGGDHPVAAHYGVMSIPTVMLVDKDGKVVSLDARGPELGQLEQLMGSSNSTSEGE